MELEIILAVMMFATAIGALLMSSLLSIVTYSVTRAQLTESREADAFVSAENTAVLINNALSSTTQISGRVKNAVNGQYLNNARITIKGSAIVVFTDQSGTYRLNQIPLVPLVLDEFPLHDEEPPAVQLPPVRRRDVP